MHRQESFVSRATCTGVIEPLFAVTPPLHTGIMNSTHHTQDQNQLVFPLFERSNEATAPQPKSPRRKPTRRSREQARLAAKRGAAQARLAIQEGSQRAAELRARQRAERRAQLLREFNAVAAEPTLDLTGPAHIHLRPRPSTQEPGSTPPPTAA